MLFAPQTRPSLAMEKTMQKRLGLIRLAALLLPTVVLLLASCSSGNKDSLFDPTAGTSGDSSGGASNSGGAGGNAGASCASGVRCGSQCVDVDSDVSHCGDCDTVCPASAECRSGACLCANG